MNPTTAMPTISAMSVSPARAKRICSVRMWATRYATTALPTITDPVEINGTTQPGWSVGNPAIVLNGQMSGPGADGLRITAGGSTVLGLLIQGFGGAGIHLSSLGSNRIAGNVLGTDPSSSDFGEGQAITERDIVSGDPYLEFPITNALNLTLQGDLADNGFVMRFKFPNTELRQIELYGSSAADSLKPRVIVTTSTPADFDP